MTPSPVTDPWPRGSQAPPGVRPPPAVGCVPWGGTLHPTPRGGRCCGNRLLPKRGPVTMATRCPRRKGGGCHGNGCPAQGCAGAGSWGDWDGDRDTAPALPALLVPTAGDPPLAPHGPAPQGPAVPTAAPSCPCALGTGCPQVPPAPALPVGGSRGAQSQPGQPLLWTLATCPGAWGRGSAHSRPLHPWHGRQPRSPACGRDAVRELPLGPSPRAEAWNLCLSPVLARYF